MSAFTEVLDGHAEAEVPGENLTLGLMLDNVKRWPCTFSRARRSLANGSAGAASAEQCGEMNQHLLDEQANDDAPQPEVTSLARLICRA